MDDVKPVSVEEKKVSQAKKRKIRISKKNIVRFIGVVIVVALFAGVYYAGDQHGAKRQKAYDDKHRSPASVLSRGNPGASPVNNRWSAIGTIQEFNDKSIKVKNSRGEIQEAVINKDTSITDKTAKKVDTKSLKKDARVIVSGTKDDKGKLTATRIRLQQ